MATTEGKPWKIVVFTAMLAAGLVLSQVAAVYMDEGLFQVWSNIVQRLTMLCLSFIMVHVGYEFNINKAQVGVYAKDYVVAMTAAAFPWLLVAAWLRLALPGSLSWPLALLIGRFAAPTSAGILFSMLEAAGLKETWLFRKARILAIFDDLDTILLMIPLKVLLVGFKWELTIDGLLVVLLLGLAWWKLHELRLPCTWRWTMLYAAVVTVSCGILHEVSHGHVQLEVLLPAFVLGCVTRLGHHDDEEHQNGNCAVSKEPSFVKAELSVVDGTEEQVATIISTMFMMLVGLSMPSLSNFQSQGLGMSSVAAHVAAVTALMVLGKMFLLGCYREEADLRTRFALSLGMCPRGEVGAGIIVISLNLGIRGPAVTVAILSLAVNLVLSSGFIMAVTYLAKAASTAASTTTRMIRALSGGRLSELSPSTISSGPPAVPRRRRRVAPALALAALAIAGLLGRPSTRKAIHGFSGKAAPQTRAATATALAATAAGGLLIVRRRAVSSGHHPKEKYLPFVKVSCSE